MSATIHWEVWDIFATCEFWCGFGGWVVASVIKMILAARRTHEFDFVYLVSTGGMPSSHSATVCGLATGLGCLHGFDAPVCVLATAFAIVTMFDAATVRRAAGEHAKVLNTIMRDIKDLKFRPTQRLKELLGHTRTEVLWGMVTGVVWAALLCCLWKR